MSEHEVNTDRLITKNSSMRHVEGGWPRDVDFTEQSDVSRFRKKAEKDDEYKGAVKLLGPIIARCMKQNNTIDIYEVPPPLRLFVRPADESPPPLPLGLLRHRRSGSFK